MLLALRHEPYHEDKIARVDLLTLKDFLKVFEYDKFGQKACEIIRKEFKNKLKKQVGLQKGVL